MEYLDTFKSVEKFNEDISKITSEEYANQKKYTERYSGLLLALAIHEIIPLEAAFPEENSKTESGADMFLRINNKCLPIQIVLAEKDGEWQSHAERKERMSNNSNLKTIGLFETDSSNLETAFEQIISTVNRKISKSYANAGDMSLLCYSNYSCPVNTNSLVVFERLLNQHYKGFFGSMGSFGTVYIWFCGFIYFCKSFGVSKMLVNPNTYPKPYPK